MPRVRAGPLWVQGLGGGAPGARKPATMCLSHPDFDPEPGPTRIRSGPLTALRCPDRAWCAAMRRRRPAAPGGRGHTRAAAARRRAPRRACASLGGSGRSGSGSGKKRSPTGPDPCISPAAPPAPTIPPRNPATTAQLATPLSLASRSMRQPGPKIAAGDPQRPTAAAPTWPGPGP